MRGPVRVALVGRELERTLGARLARATAGPTNPENAPHCESCGAELVAPARFCGFCEREANLAPESRACAICGCDITGRRGDAETCGPAHKKALQRQRAAASAAKASIRTGESRWKCTLRLANSIERVEDALADGAITVVTGRQTGSQDDAR